MDEAEHLDRLQYQYLTPEELAVKRLSQTAHKLEAGTIHGDPRMFSVKLPRLIKSEASQDFTKEEYDNFERTCLEFVVERMMIEDKMCARCYKTATRNQPLKACSRCRIVKYCSAECQKAKWPFHKTVCVKRGKKKMDEAEKVKDVSLADGTAVINAVAEAQDIDKRTSDSKGAAKDDSEDDSKGKESFEKTIGKRFAELDL